MIKGTIVAGILAGSVAFGALTTYNGGAAIDLAQSKITQQAEELGLFKSQQTQMVEKLTVLKAELADLKENGTIEDQVRIDELTAEVTTLEANINSAGTQIEDEINRLEGEINKANTDAAELEATVVAAGETPEAMYQSELDNLMDLIPDGYAKLEMVAGTPQIVYDKNGNATGVTIDKTGSTAKDSNLNVIVSGLKNYYVTLEGQPQQLVEGGKTLDLGKIEDLDAKKLTIHDTTMTEVGKYYLSAGDIIPNTTQQ